MVLVSCFSSAASTSSVDSLAAVAEFGGDPGNAVGAARFVVHGSYPDGEVGVGRLPGGPVRGRPAPVVEAGAGDAQDRAQPLHAVAAVVVGDELEAVHQRVSQRNTSLPCAGSRVLPPVRGPSGAERRSWPPAVSAARPVPLPGVPAAGSRRLPGPSSARSWDPPALTRTVTQTPARPGRRRAAAGGRGPGGVLRPPADTTEATAQQGEGGVLLHRQAGPQRRDHRRRRSSAGSRPAGGRTSNTEQRWDRLAADRPVALAALGMNWG